MSPPFVRTFLCTAVMSVVSVLNLDGCVPSHRLRPFLCVALCTLFQRWTFPKTKTTRIISSLFSS